MRLVELIEDQTEGEAYRQGRSVVVKEDEVGGRARVPRNEEQVLRES